MDLHELFHGPNAGVVAELYEQYTADPASVDPQLQTLFANWQPDYESGYQNGATPSATITTMAAPVASGNGYGAAVANLANAIRNYGHVAAHTDPLRPDNTHDDPLLELSGHGLTEAALAQLPGHVVSGPIGQAAPSATAAIQQLRAVYTGTIGYDFAHIVAPDEREWLRQMAETRHFHPDNDPIDRKKVLQELTQVEGFEQYLHRKFVGKKRFSIEGLDMMVPMLNVILDGAVRDKVNNVMIGMAHRGRLNVLTHVMRKPYRQMLAEFKDIVEDSPDQNWTGDVKYHYGSVRQLSDDVQIKMVDNPSHLELVNPVLEGMARAAGTAAEHPGAAVFDKKRVMPILIHGDAAFIGQGIVPETLNLSLLSGWRTGGTIHMIANNQIGFTTDYMQSRSTPYASDVAKGFRIPVVHVNADDIEACIEVARLAYAYQMRFEKDFLIDLIGYRRYGHNEGDEPRFTQPTMYALIDEHETARALWAGNLEQRGDIQPGDANALLEAHFAEMEAAYKQINLDAPQMSLEHVPDRIDLGPQETAVSAEELRAYHEELHQLENKVLLNSRLARILKRRKNALDNMDEPTIDWGHAEWLAFASILADGTPIRLTGEDVERGTFSHRHAVLRDQNTGDRYVPHQVLSHAQASFECRNSALTENAAIGFEYGYSLQAPERLVIWEAQFGDFVNGAQPMIDEFITSGRAKWDQKSSLVMLMPHGYEGQGPDHSTARLERWLTMAADRNMRIVNPTTAAQIFHLFRRQVEIMHKDPRPLIVMSPKSLLRHPLSRSPLRELTEGTWKHVIDDPTITPQRKRFIKRLVLCSGKVYVDAMMSDHRPEKPDVALVRIEQLYRFPMGQVSDLIDSYKGIEEVVWLQEEPMNGGAWKYVQPLLERIVQNRLPIKYIGRPNRASPAEGYFAWHKSKQDEIMREVYGG